MLSLKPFFSSQQSMFLRGLRVVLLRKIQVKPPRQWVGEKFPDLWTRLNVVRAGRRLWSFPPQSGGGVGGAGGVGGTQVVGKYLNTARYHTDLLPSSKSQTLFSFLFSCDGFSSIPFDTNTSSCRSMKSMALVDMTFVKYHTDLLPLKISYFILCFFFSVVVFLFNSIDVNTYSRRSMKSKYDCSPWRS